MRRWEGIRLEDESALTRHKTEWPYADPNPLGAPRQSRTTVYRLLPRLIRRPGAKDPDHEYVATPPSTGTIAARGTHPPG